MYSYNFKAYLCHDNWQLTSQRFVLGIPRYALNRGCRNGSACSGENSSAPTGFRTPLLSFQSLVTLWLHHPSSKWYIFKYIHLFNSEVALKWDSKHFIFIFEISRIQISAPRPLFFMKVQVFNFCFSMHHYIWVY